MSQVPWFPIHIHYLPRSQWSYPLRGAVVCIEWRSQQLRRYYGLRPRLSQTPGDRIEGFIDAWSNLVRGTPLEALDRVCFSVEGESDLGDLSRLAHLRRRGLSVIQIFHRGPNRYIDPSGGLSPQGRELLAFIASEGLILDLSHLQGQLLDCVLEQYVGRRIVSHVVCEDLLAWSLVRRSNALSAHELRACDAELYGVPFVDDLLSAHPALEPSEREVGLATVADHVVALAEIVGGERTALGPDFFDPDLLAPSGIHAVPVPLSDTAEGLVRLRGLLVDRGVSPAKVEAIFWKNAAFVFKEEGRTCA